MMRRVVYLLLGVMVTACSSIDCPVDATVATLYKVYSSDGKELVLSDTLTVTSTRSNGKDTTLLNMGIGISSFSLPVSYSHPEDVLVFHFFNQKNNDLNATDTVWVKKDDYPHFESVDCNTSFFHTLTDVKYTSNYIDSIVIKNPSVTYDSKTVHFYLYPKSNN